MNHPYHLRRGKAATGSLFSVLPHCDSTRGGPALTENTLAHKRTRGRGPTPPPLLGGEFAIMDCGLPCPLSCHGKVMLVVCVLQCTVNIALRTHGRSASGPEFNVEVRPVYCSGASGTRLTRARASKAGDILGIWAGLRSCRRTKPAMSRAISASVKAERHAFLFSSRTARYRSTSLRSRLCDGSSANSGGEAPNWKTSPMCCDMTIPP